MTINHACCWHQSNDARPDTSPPVPHPCAPCRRIGKGSTLYLPVAVAGAYLSMGDAHMAQVGAWAVCLQAAQSADMCAAEVAAAPGKHCTALDPALPVLLPAPGSHPH